MASLSSTLERLQKVGRLAMGASTENNAHSGIGGAPPIITAAVPLDAYLAAREQALKDF